MIEVIEFMALLISFTVTGPIIIRNLWVYFEKAYNQQRYSLLIALLLTIMSLLVLSLRFILEFIYNAQGLQIGGDDSEKPTDPDAKPIISVTACFAIIVVSDLLPIVSLMLCIWISSKGRWDSLMSGCLTRRIDSDDSTYAGSVMLEGLRAEIFANDTLILSSGFNSFHEYPRGPDSKWGSVASVLNKIPEHTGLQISHSQTSKTS